MTKVKHIGVILTMIVCTACGAPDVESQRSEDTTTDLRNVPEPTFFATPEISERNRDRTRQAVRTNQDSIGECKQRVIEQMTQCFNAIDYDADPTLVKRKEVRCWANYTIGLQRCERKPVTKEGICKRLTDGMDEKQRSFAQFCLYDPRDGSARGQEGVESPREGMPLDEWCQNTLRNYLLQHATHQRYCGNVEKK